MILATFNGWNVLALPPQPGFQDLSLVKRNTVGSYMSPFTMQSQFQRWTGADRWEGHAILPPMTRTQAAPWDAWLAECAGMANAFSLPLPFNGAKLPGGAEIVGAPVVNASGGNAAGASTLAVRGFPANAMRLLLPGDYIQVGYRLHVVLDVVNANGSGDATLNLWPSLREVPPDGEAVLLHNTTCLCRMAKNEQSAHVDKDGLWHLEFDFIEAR